MCKEWDTYKAFYQWAILSGYKQGLSIDRINNDGNYEPANCRWATAKEQQRNTSRNRKIEYNGKSLTMPEWEEITGVSKKLISQRSLNGWDSEKIFTAPNNPHQKPVAAIKDGAVFGTYPNIAQAEKALGVSGTHISACLKGKRKHAGGFEWRETNGN